MKTFTQVLKGQELLDDWTPIFPEHIKCQNCQEILTLANEEAFDKPLRFIGYKIYNEVTVPPTHQGEKTCPVCNRVNIVTLKGYSKTNNYSFEWL